ncbi:hypothetical protein [Azospirillum sp.]|uniref:hypothetical protein n=1 Tax=Azospirillum sp. TaxID=34012 RepID=UPI003D74D8D2
MSVRIPITADASSVANAFEQIRTAIRRAGQEGKAFKDLDLSHPELKGVSDDLQRMQKNYEDLLKIGRGATAAAVRGIGAQDWGGWYDQHVRAFPDENERKRHTSQAGRYILNGTRYAPPAPGGGTPGGGGGGAGGSGPGGGSGGSSDGSGGIKEEAKELLSFGKRAIPWMIGLAGVQKVGSMLATGIGQAQDEAVGVDAYQRHLRDAGTDFDTLRKAVRATTDGLQLTYAESLRLSESWVNLTNETNHLRAQDQVRFAAGFARGYGLDPAAMTNGLGKAAFLGEDPKRFALMIGEAVREGGMTGQVLETMQAVLRFSEANARQNVHRTGAEGFAAMYSGLNALGFAGLKGAGAEHLINQINQAVTQGGAGGEASQHLTYRALARRGIIDPYQIEYLLAGGMFESPRQAFGPGNDGATNFEIMREEINRMYDGMPEYQKLHALSRHFGINIRQAEALSKFHYGDMSKASNWLGSMGLNMANVNPTSLADIASIMGADGNELEGWRKKLLDRKELSGGERSIIESEQGESLKQELVRAMARIGMEKTEGTRVTESLADLSNELTKIGSALIPATNNIRDLVADIAKGVNHFAGPLGDAMRAILEGDKAATRRIDEKLEDQLRRHGAWSMRPPGGTPADQSGPASSGGAPAVPPVGLPSAPFPGRKPDPASSLPGLGPTSFLPALEGAESANGTQMEAERSSAAGWHQFTKGTWLKTVDKYGGFRVAGMTKEQKLALRYDREFSRLMADAHINNDLAPELRGHDVEVTPLSLYAGWHFGGKTGAKIMKADKDAMMESLVGDDAMDANPYLRGMTAGRWREMFGKKFGKVRLDGGEKTPGATRMEGQTPGLPRSEGPAGGTPLPAGDPRSTVGRVQGDFNISPLRVVHETPEGEVKGIEYLPVTDIGDPRPWGIG